MVRRRCRKNAGSLAESAIDRLKPFQKTGNGPWTYRNVVVDAYMALAKFAGFQCYFLAGIRLLYDKEFSR